MLSGRNKSAPVAAYVIPELVAGRVDPRVGPGRVGSGHEYFQIPRVGSGRVSGLKK